MWICLQLSQLLGFIDLFIYIKLIKDKRLVLKSLIKTGLMHTTHLIELGRIC